MVNARLPHEPDLPPPLSMEEFDAPLAESGGFDGDDGHALAPLSRDDAPAARPSDADSSDDDGDSDIAALRVNVDVDSDADALEVKTRTCGLARRVLCAVAVTAMAVLAVVAVFALPSPANEQLLPARELEAAVSTGAVQATLAPLSSRPTQAPTAARDSRCPTVQPYLQTPNLIEPAKLCWESARGADSECTDWCLLPQFVGADPGGHLRNCPGNVCCGRASDPGTGCPACCTKTRRRRGLFGGLMGAVSVGRQDATCTCLRPALATQNRAQKNYASTAAVTQTGNSLSKALVSFSGSVSVLKASDGQGAALYWAEAKLDAKIALGAGGTYKVHAKVLMNRTSHTLLLHTCVRKDAEPEKCTCQSRIVNNSDVGRLDRNLPFSSEHSTYARTVCPAAGGACADVYTYNVRDFLADSASYKPTITMTFAHASALSTSEPVLRMLDVAVPVQQGSASVTIQGKAVFAQVVPPPDIASLRRTKQLAALHPCTPPPSEPCQCIFPFRYRGVRYTNCTRVDDSDLWCATKVNEKGEYVQRPRPATRGGGGRGRGGAGSGGVGAGGIDDDVMGMGGGESFAYCTSATKCHKI